MNKRISVIIPNYNGSSTLGRCLEAAFSSEYDNLEVIVTDDCSTDNSVEIIKKFPCKLILLDKHSGASRARNAGAENSTGTILFFIDADCLIQKDTLIKVNMAFSGAENAIIGGAYTKIPCDDGFFSTFQSIFINYSETKKKEPDYIATHAMALDSGTFRKTGGFAEGFLPILEDVEFSHRLRKMGYKLVMEPEIVVQHIFNFNFMKSLKNAFKKSFYWTIYSLKNKDILKDSGTASLELKFNVMSFFISLLLICLFLLMKNYFALAFSVIIQVVNIRIINKTLIKEFFEVKGLSFTFLSCIYYFAIYPIAVGAGSFAGIIDYLLKYRK